MHRNKFWEKEKEYLRLISALNDNHVAQSNLGYIELEKPIHKGYEAYFVLREDISRREDAWVFQYILDVFGISAWRRKNDFLVSKINRKRGLKDKYDYHQYPRLEHISEYVYNQSPPQVKKWITIKDKYTRWGHYKEYWCNVPMFFFEIEVVRHYETKIKLIDNVLLQEEEEIKQKLLNYPEFGYYSWLHSCPKSYRRFFNVSDRRKSKQEIHKIIRNGMDESEANFPYRHKHSAQWAFW